MSLRFDTAGEGCTRALTGLSITSFTICGWGYVVADNAGYAVIGGVSTGANRADVYVNWGNSGDGLAVGSYMPGGGGGSFAAGDGSIAQLERAGHLEAAMMVRGQP